MDKSLKNKVIPVFAIGILGVVTVGILLFIELFSVPTGIDYTEPIRVTIPRGASLSEISNILQTADLVEEEWKFETAARLFRLDRRIRAGKYRFTKPLSPIGLAKALTTAGYFDILATFPEGSTVFTIARIARDSVGIDSTEFVNVCFDTSFIQSIGIEAPSLEGYLYPETYSLPEGVTAQDLAQRMVAHFKTRWDDIMNKRSVELGFSRGQILTLASIIEAEAKVHWERPVISSVYHNRLKKGMLLQADPTVIYGLRSFSRPLTRADLDTSTSPYNTYKYAGLPRGAICNPGIGSIYAALWPDSTEYLFFVSNEDGTHWFTRELTDHYAAIEAIRRRGEHGPIPEVIIGNRKLVKDITAPIR